MELYVQKGPKIGPEIDVKLLYVNNLDYVAGKESFELPIEVF